MARKASTRWCGSLRTSADRAREQHLLRGVDAPAAGRGVERVEQAVVGGDVGAGQAVEQCRFARVRVAHEGDDGQIVFLPSSALLGADLAHIFQIFAQLLDARADVALVGLELRLARASGADAAAEAAHLLIPDGEPGQVILILRQLDLELALARLGPLGEDVEDERAAVEHGGL